MTVEAFNKALTHFQAEIPHVGKDQTAEVPMKAGGSYSYSYADLTLITDKALPLLAKHGLSFTAFPTMGEYGFVLKYSLRHVDGHVEDGFYPLPDASKTSPQEIGSAITYARRYSLCAVTGIAPGGEDDDGQTASASRSAPRRTADPLAQAKTRVWAAAQRIGWENADLITDFAREHGGELIGDADVETLTAYAVRLEISAPVTQQAAT